MRRALLAALTLGALALTACEIEPCDDYVDYMCSCHDSEEGFDCAELTEIYVDAEPNVQDQCAIDLGDQKQTDEDEGVECETAI